MADGDGDRRGNAHALRLVTSGILVVLILWFAFANGGRVKIDYLVVTRNSRLIYVILGSAALGACAGRLFQWRRRHGGD